MIALQLLVMMEGNWNSWSRQEVDIIAAEGAQMIFVRTLLLAIATTIGSQATAQDKQFSGPQPGEKLAGFKVRGFFEPNAGKELDFVQQASGKPIVLVFVHDANRQSLRFTQVLTNYSVGVEGMYTGVVWLSDDVTDAENFLKRSGHALARKAPTGISLDGREGPGAYGLNRNVTLTVLVGKESRVTENFALVQPSIQSDLPKVLQAIATVTGGEPATLEDLLIVANYKLQGPLSLLADLDARDEDVERHVATIEALVKEDASVGQELGRVTSRILSTGMLSKRGTALAQEHFKRWAKEYGVTVSP